MLTYALVTPSHAPDFERCRVLVESVRRHAAAFDHHLVVDRCDLRLFAPLAGPRTHVLTTEDVIPSWLHRVPFFPKWWLNLTGRPTRGWIVQQIVKLSVDAFTRADVLLFCDSDCFFIRPFDPHAAERDGRVPLFVETLPRHVDFNAVWLARAAEVCGLPLEPGCRRNYVSNAVTWRRANVLALHRRIEEVTGRPWAEALCALPTLSEYTLYGVFCERVLGAASGQYADSHINILPYWDPTPLDEPALAALRARLRPEHVGVMVSSKSGTPIAAIQRAFAAAG